MTELLSQLSENGTLAAIIAVLFALNIYQYNQYSKIQEKRVEDANKVRDSIVEPLNKVEQTLNTMLDLLIRSGKHD